MTDAREQLLLPLLFAVPAGDEWQPPLSHQEVVAERILELVREEAQ